MSCISIRARWRAYRRIGSIAAGLWLSVVATPACALGMSWGVNGHSLWFYPGTLDHQMALARDLGAKWYRVDIHPHTWPPSPDDELSANALAALIPVARAYGIEILVTICPEVANKDLETEASYYQKSYNWARWLALRFHNDIHVWELDNEIEPYAMVRPCETMDNGLVWDCTWGDAGGTDPFDYIAVRYNRLRGDIRGLGDGIASVDPTARRIVNLSAGFHYGFLQRLITDGVPFEISGPHWYSSYGDIENCGLGINCAMELWRLGKPIWITEFNKGYGSYLNTEAEQATVTDQMMRQWCAIAPAYGIESAHFYQLQDEPYHGSTNFESFMGLIQMVPDPQLGWTYGNPKPAYHAFKAVATGCQPL